MVYTARWRVYFKNFWEKRNKKARFFKQAFGRYISEFAAAGCCPANGDCSVCPGRVAGESAQRLCKEYV